MDGGGFEPPKQFAADLQSVPFGHLGTPPYEVAKEKGGAGGRIRTPDLLITNQLLYQLSYTSTVRLRVHNGAYYSSGREICQQVFSKIDREMGRRDRGTCCGAVCAGGSCTPGTPISRWRAGRCARTASDGTPGIILPTAVGGWAGTKGRTGEGRYDTVRAITGIRADGGHAAGADLRAGAGSAGDRGRAAPDTAGPEAEAAALHVPGRAGGGAAFERLLPEIHPPAGERPGGSQKEVTQCAPFLMRMASAWRI